MARARRGFVRGAARRRTGWNLGPASGASGGFVQTISATGSLLMTQGFLVVTDGVTLIRVRGQLMLALATVAAAGDGFTGAFGIGVVPGGARGFTGVGGGALPIPITNAEDETWIWHQFFAMQSIVASVDQSEGSAVYRQQVDTKAMRKMNDGDILYASIEVAEVGTATMDIHFDSRALFKLP